MFRSLPILLGLCTVAFAADPAPRFSREVEAVFSRAGCNSGTCHGGVKGQNGFRLSLFGADPTLDHDQIVRDVNGRRVNRIDPDKSLLLLKGTAQIPHEGGKRIAVDSPEYKILRDWIAAGMPADAREQSRVTKFKVTPSEKTLKVGESANIRIEATFADNSTADVTSLCSYEVIDGNVAAVDRNGQVAARGVGETAVVIRFRAEPVLARFVVPRQSTDAFPDVKPNNFIDQKILAKLKQLNVPPTDVCDDATFLRRVTLDLTGELPTAKEARDFVADKSVDKRTKKIDELLKKPGHAAVWTLKFCDLLKATDFGVYADGMRQEVDAPRFQAWVRARLEENVPYDQFVERILLATSRDGKPVEDWAKSVVAMEEGYSPGRKDLEMYQARNTLDLYWQRSSSTGVSGALQVAHSFLGLRLECAQCHRHPHDVWQQDDLLSFANFFRGMRKIGFGDQNAKKFPEVGAIFTKLNEDSKKLEADVKKLREGELKKLEADAKKSEADKAAFEKMKKQVADMDRQSKLMQEAARRVMHAEVRIDPAMPFATVSSPIGTQTSNTYRLFGESKNITVAKDEDPRKYVMEWMRRPDNPYFARAIVNRVWAYYFGRGLVDPPDNLSSFNPASHPELMQELCDGFIKNKYDLRWLHRTIVSSRTYQQSYTTTKENEFDRANYASFYLRRLPAEVIVDVLNQVTGTNEKMEMEYHHWPKDIKTVEVPFTPKNGFVTYMLATFGKPKRNSAVQCDCERDSSGSVIQVLSVANHPRIAQKLNDKAGTAAIIVQSISDDRNRIDELYLTVLGRFPTDTEQKACMKYMKESKTPVEGVQGILWSLVNTKEFLVQH